MSNTLPADESTAEAELAQKTGRIVERLHAINGYGGLRVTTYVPDIPGAEYSTPWRRSPDQRSLGAIGSELLQIEGEGEDVVVLVQTDTEPYILKPSEIETAEVDHVFGRSMPLHGRLEPAICLDRYTGVPALRWPDHFIEYGWRARIESMIHPRYPNLGIIRGHKADSLDREAAPSLEEAMAGSEHPFTFFISKVVYNPPHSSNFFGLDAIITSRIGYEVSTPVIIRHPRHQEELPRKEIEMIDFAADTTDEDLLKAHLDRLKKVRGSDRSKLSLFELDDIYLYITND